VADSGNLGVTDTIVALATPPGEGALAVVRLSGPRAGALLLEVAPGLGGTLPPPRRATLTRLVDPVAGSEVERALVTWFPGPASYTGEDVVEISGHGGRLAPLLVESAFLGLGARRAEPGEFTRRAYVEGKVDLVQAEAVGDLVAARNRALHGAALRQLDGGLSRRLADLRRGLVELEALLVHHLDFPEEDDAPVPLEQVIARATALAHGLRALEATAPEGELLRSGALVVLAGRPNAGKSSLFNALIGEQRALVTEVPGTTRDALEVEVSVGGFPFRLVDTAGLRESDEVVERMGIEVAHRYLAAASAILFCVECGRAVESDERAAIEGWRERGITVLLVRTKADLTGDSTGHRGEERPSDEPADHSRTMHGQAEIPLSTVTGVGLDVLRRTLPRAVYRELSSAAAEAPVLTNARQRAGVVRGREEVEGFASALADGVPAEMAATHLRAAETALEEVLGVLSPDEVLDQLFRNFCIGK
jgi:tRNA modification GTPase